MTTHTDEYKNNDCDKAFIVETELNSHMNTHTLEIKGFIVKNVTNVIQERMILINM